MAKNMYMVKHKKGHFTLIKTLPKKTNKIVAMIPWNNYVLLATEKGVYKLKDKKVEKLKIIHK